MEDASFKSPNRLFYVVPVRPCFSHLSGFLSSHIQFTAITSPVTTTTQTNIIKIRLAGGVSISIGSPDLFAHFVYAGSLHVSVGDFKTMVW